MYPTQGLQGEIGAPGTNGGPGPVGPQGLPGKDGQVGAQGLVVRMNGGGKREVEVGKGVCVCGTVLTPVVCLYHRDLPDQLVILVLLVPRDQV